MSVIIGRVSEYDGSNVTVGGKVIFLPPEKRNAASNNFPVGSVVKVMVETGTAKSIVPPTETEMAAFTRGELTGNKPTSTPAKFTKSAVVSEPPKEHTMTPAEKAEFKEIFLDLIRNDPEIRAKFQEIIAEAKAAKEGGGRHD
jgi:hypothetical protein